MKTKIVFLASCILLLIVFSVHAVAVHEGTVQKVETESRQVTIDSIRYQLSHDAPVFRETAPDVMLPLSAQLEGTRVHFDLRQVESNEAKIGYLMVLDK